MTITKKMKINFLEPHLSNTSGGIRRIICVANNLVRRGHEVKIFAPTDWLKKPKWIGFDDRIELKDERYWHKDKADIAIFNLYEQYKLFRRTPVKKKVYYLLHHETLYNGRDNKLYKDKELNFIAVSNWVSKKIGKINGRKIPVTYGGIYTDIFKPINLSKEIDVLGFGNPVPWKGTSDFKLAMKILENRMTSINYDLFYGRDLNQHEVAQMYNKAKVFVSASHFEGWNNTALEAMACGVPLVCTEIGGNADFAVAGKNCLRVPSKDPKALADAIEILLTNPNSVAEKMVKNGLKTAKKFTWEKVVDVLEKYIINLK